MAGGKNNVGVVEKAHALFSGHATGLIFVLSLDRTASAISPPESCQMRPAHSISLGQTTKQVMGEEEDSMHTRIMKKPSP